MTEKHVFEFKRLENGDPVELMGALQGACTEANIKRGLLSIIGAVDRFTISTMPAHDAGQDNITSYDLPAEIHGIGEVVDGQAHLHATFATEGDVARAGHVHGALIGTHFVRAYVELY